MIVALAQHGTNRNQIAESAGVHYSTVERWSLKNQSGFTISDQPRSGRTRVYSTETENRFIAFYCQTKPFETAGRWSLRWAESFLKKNTDRVGGAPSRSTACRILNRHDLKPHKNRYFLQITDPDFFEKMERLIGLYRNPPEYLFCFDECPGIQILKRLTPDLHPGDEGGMLRWVNEFEYIRNGTTDLFAFLDVNSGTVKAGFHANHKKETFLREFLEHVKQYPKEAVLNYIMDNLAAHCSYEFCLLIANLCGIECPLPKSLATPAKRRQWLQCKDKRIIINFTPFHGSWLNMSEIVFRLVGEKVLKDSYSSPDELHDAAMEYFRQWNENWAHPFTWKYDGKGLHQKTVQRFTSVLNHSAAEITLQYLAKSSLLMVSMIDNHWDEVPGEAWQKLFALIDRLKAQLGEMIALSAQPVVSKKARVALDKLLLKITEVNEIEPAA